MNNFIVKTDYSVRYAGATKRFVACLCDYLILLVVAMAIVSLIAKQEIKEYNELQEIKNRKPVEIILETADAENDDEKIEASTEEELASLKKELVEDVEKKQREILYNVTKNKTVKTILMLVVFLYHLFFILSKQQATPGQRIFNLVVVRMDGGTVTFKDALNRVTLLLLLDILAIFCIFSKNRFTVYDYLSKTAVIEVK